MSEPDETDHDVRTLDPAARRRLVRDRYATIASEGSGCCGDDSIGAQTCCDATTEQQAREVGYDADELEVVPSGANLGLGCGNPTAMADLEPGETILDLGSGGGFDCFLAAAAVGEEGHVIGVDMTPSMIDRARRNAEQHEATSVEFRLGEIEHLPVGDATIDVILSNCVINLSPDKQRAFDEAFRVLRPGGRLAITDVVETVSLPDDIRDDPDSLAACVAGAASISSLEAMLAGSGFEDIRIDPKDGSESFIDKWDADRPLGDYLRSAEIMARKPSG